MGIPMMVDSDWLAAVDAFVRANADGVPAPVNAADSRFYDVRPVSIRSGWIQKGDSASPWIADAAFIVNDTVDTSFVFPVFAYGYKPNVSGVGYAVWRGRWEFLGSPSIRLRLSTDVFLKDLGPSSTVSVPTKLATKTTDVVAAPLAASFKSVVTNVSLLSSGMMNSIPYVDSVKLENGVLKVTTKTLSLSISKGQFYVLDSLPSSVEAVTEARVTQTSSVVTGYPNVEKANAIDSLSFILPP